MRPRAASRVAPALVCLLALACNSSSKRAPTPRASGVPSASAASTTSAAPSSSAASAPSASAAATAPKLSTVRTDETVVVFPALGSWDAPTKSWRLELHVWIYEPEEDSKRRQILTDAIAKALKVGPNDKEREVLQRRLRPFLADNESGKRLAIQLDETQLTLPESADDGHALSTVYIPEALVPASGGARRMQIVLSDIDSRRFQAVAYFLPPKGTLVVSDIDDTVKITEVTDTAKLVRRTFLQPFSFVKGLPRSYEKLLGTNGHLHFLSSSPWQLFPELSTQLRGAGFPPATYSLKRFRPAAFELDKLLADPLQTKASELEKLARRFPLRQFVLVGDSGEQDPEVYGAFARKHPKLVTRIAIRNVTDEKPDSDRIKAAFKGIAAEKWQLFSKPAELK